MNIPKKLEDTRWQSTHFAIEDLENKINELIDYLQANKPVGCCCIKKHSTGEVSKKDKSYKAVSSVCCGSSFRLGGDTKEGTMYHVCNNCNKACDIELTEKKVEASKKDKYLCYTCNQWGIVGEHECEASKGERESIECLKEKVKKNIINHSHAIYEELYPPEHEESPHGYKLRHEDCEDCIKATGDAWKPKMSEYVSKEKIKEYVSDKLNCYSNPDYRVALKDLSESLGLGD